MSTARFATTALHLPSTVSRSRPPTAPRSRMANASCAPTRRAIGAMPSFRMPYSRRVSGLALVQADGDQAPRGSSADRARIAEIEAMLHDPSGAGQRRYWNDGGLRADYTQALARVMGEPETSESDGSELAAQKSPEVASDSTAQPIV